MTLPIIFESFLTFSAGMDIVGMETQAFYMLRDGHARMESQAFVHAYSAELLSAPFIFE